MKRFVLLVLSLLLCVACSSPRGERAERNVGSTRTALTTYTVAPGAVDLPLSSGGPEIGVAETLPVPAGEPILDSFTIDVTLTAGAKIQAVAAHYDAGTGQPAGIITACPVFTAAAAGAHTIGCASGASVGAATAIVIYAVLDVLTAASGSVAATTGSPFAGFASTIDTAGVHSPNAAIDIPFSATFSAPPLTPTSTSLTASTETPVWGQTVTLSASVTPSGTGTVEFFDGTTSLGTGALAGGSTSIAVSSLGLDGHAITAVYGGDAAHAGSTSTVTTVTVGRAATSLTVDSSPRPSTPGAAVTFSGTVAATAPGAGTRTGTVTITSDLLTTGDVCVALVQASGAYSCASTALAVGTHAITATYGGDSHFLGSTSAGPSHAVSYIATTVAVSTAPTSSTFGDPITVSAKVTATSGAPTGTVSFDEAGTPLGSAAIVGDTATITVSGLVGGAHTITAVYPGTSVFAGGTGSIGHVVGTAPTSIAVTSSKNPSVFGESVDFTATITPAAATGTVTFYDGASVFATRTIAGGTAVATAAALDVRGHTITAQLALGRDYAASTSPDLTQTVNRAATATSIAASANPSLVGQTLSFSATVTAVAPGSGTPGGSVRFDTGSGTLGTAPLNASGVATVAANALPAGARVVTATYLGDASYAGSASSGLTHSVNQNGVSVAHAAAPSTIAYGGATTLTATVSSTSGGTPTGNVTFLEGTTALGTAALDGSGVATLNAPGLGGGPHTLVARYEGDLAHVGGATGTTVVTVTKATTTTSLTSSSDPSSFGQPVTLGATVTSGVAGVRTGSITFKDGAVTIGSCVVAGTGCSLVTSALSTATHPLTATYDGDANYAESTSAVLDQDVDRSATTTTLVSSSSPSLIDTVVTFRATVAPVAPGAGVPAGNVTFRDGATVIGTGVLSPAGVASVATSALTAGTHTIVAEYAGNTDFAPSSADFSQRVSTFAATIALTSSVNPSAFGAGVTFGVTVTGVNGTPTGSVVFREQEIGDLSAPVVLDGSGAASLTIATLSAGPRTITVAYSGDDTYATATGSLSQVVDQQATTTTITTSGSPVAAGARVTFTANVASSLGGVTGQVEFFAGSSSLGAVPLRSNVASLTTTTLGVGNHVITATYRGTTNFASSTSAPLTQTVGLTGPGGPLPAGTTPPDSAGVDPGNSQGSVEGDGCACHAAKARWSGRSVAALLVLGAAAINRRRRRAA